MAEATVRPGVVAGRVRAPPSKSVTHRAYLLAAQSETPCVVRNPLRAADTDATLGALHALGARVLPTAGDVRFEPAPWVAPRGVLDCRNAGTALRLLTAAVARWPWPATLDGDVSLRQRPNAPLLDALATMGARVDPARGTCPYTVRGPLRPGDVALPPATSSQFASALLLSMPFLEGTSTLTLRAPVASRPYLDVTEHVAWRAGLAWTRADSAAALCFEVPGGQRPRADRLDVDGDWSAAAFFVVAAAITRGRVALGGLDPDGPQGDRAILELVRAFGARVAIRRGGEAATPPSQAGRGGPAKATIEVEGAPLVSPGIVDVGATPDLFPPLAVLAANAQGTTRFVGGAALRQKESDRIVAMAQGLQRLGVLVREQPDGMEVTGVPGRIQGGKVACHADHRIHMAFSVAALAANGPVRLDAGCEAVSHPTFHRDLEAILE